jgi:uncharacterized protein YndB with AHSA1/START domain
MLRWTLWILAGLVAVVGLVGLIGLALPKGHRASRTITLAAAPSVVFATISDFARYPDWRSDVKKIAVEGAGVGALVREENSTGTIPFRVEVLQPPSRVVMRIADPNLPFGGSWTYDLRAEGSGTSLTLTEDGEVYNPVFRFMQKFFFSPYKTIDTYLENLKKKVG